jgi:tetratricopeptide (TPR) repeat protein
MNSRRINASRIFAAMTLAAITALIAVSVGRGEWNDGRAPLPFVWRDMALVHLACALPLAWLASQWLNRRAPMTFAALISTVLLGIGLAFTEGAIRIEMPGVVLRALTAFAFALPATIAIVALIGVRAAPSRGARQTLLFVMLGLIALLAAPVFYLQARTRHDRARLADYLDQGRVGDARSLVHAMLALGAQADWQGQPLSKLAAALNEHAGKLETLVADPLPADANDSIRLQRARQLAILGRTEEALDALPNIDDPDVANLRGTIHEARGEWALALAAFQSAKAANTGQTPARIRAITGIAYAQRKAGDYVAAEASYQELLALAPSAETHFLLAQFYEDAQNAGKATHHARQAILLHPERYRKDGEQLIRKLSVFQFGCLRALGSSSVGR